MSNFCTNINYLLELNNLKQEPLAIALGWSRPVLAKLVSGQRLPAVHQLIKIANHFSIDPADFELDPSAFKDRVAGQASSLPLRKFRSIGKNSAQWLSHLERYGGQYFVYYRQNKKGVILSSLLSFDGVTPDGMRAAVINPHEDQTGTLTAYEYDGYAYPVGASIYCMFEQKHADYEILSIVLHEARTPSVSVLRGMISGIGVASDGAGYIAARPLVAVKNTKTSVKWRNALGRELGYLPEAMVDTFIVRELSQEKITVKG